MTRCLDFDLGIRKDGDRYLARVNDSPAGKSPDEYPFLWPFSEAHVDLLRELELALATAHGFRKAGPFVSKEEGVLREFGSKVFEAIFRGIPQISDLYSRSQQKVSDNTTLRIKLRVGPPELSVLPWEYAYDPVINRQFVCLVRNQHMVRFHDPKPTGFGRLRRPVRILAMIAKAADVEEERTRIEQVFAGAVKDGKCAFRWVIGATREALLDAISRGPWDIFHFIGHGGTAPYTDGQGTTHNVGFIELQPPPTKTSLSDEASGTPDRMFPTELANALRFSETRLAVLNCCDSGRGTGLSNMGSALVLSGIPQVLAMQFRITEEAATVFSGWFYESLLRGETVEASLGDARMKMDVHSHLEWGIPVLYTRTEPTAMFPPSESPDARDARASFRAAREQAQEPEPPDNVSAAQERFRRLWLRRPQ